jgi:hypothetical protein
MTLNTNGHGRLVTIEPNTHWPKPRWIGAPGCQCRCTSAQAWTTCPKTPSISPGSTACSSCAHGSFAGTCRFYPPARWSGSTTPAHKTRHASRWTRWWHQGCSHHRCTCPLPVECISLESPDHAHRVHPAHKLAVLNPAVAGAPPPGPGRGARTPKLDLPRCSAANYSSPPAATRKSTSAWHGSSKSTPTSEITPS